jgi:hypothetical protein
MSNHYTGSLAPAAGQLHLCLEDFERADIRVAERRFGAREPYTHPAIPMVTFTSCSRAQCACTRYTATTRTSRSRC